MIRRQFVALFLIVSIVGCGDCADRKQLAEGGIPDAAPDERVEAEDFVRGLWSLPSP